ncbi:prepilin peptidase [Bacillus sp. H-16]|uniref:prepilin peptidase n=1 Tax=Alteribacter salitolerans TaxID=2912333 RepID=UPI001962E608|nr:A24 family peptidase [Alteribacter salitolerans]MBM7098003.1 prepilin peptidase [Alteribacter salitolerans]
MEILISVYVFLFGLIFGSFFNLVGMRMPNKESIIKPRSRCPECGHSLSAWELIPVLSYVILRGKCKDCGKRVSPLYPLMETATGGLFLLSYLHWGFSFELIVSLLFVSMLVIITVSDLTSYLILNKVLMFFFIPLLLLRLTVADLYPWWIPIVGMLTGFGILFALAVLSKGGMGGGDVKLYAVIGVVLGFPGVLMSIFFASLIGAVIGIFGVLFKGMNRKSSIPFGPSIALGSIIVYFYGIQIWNWYMKIF